MRAFRYNAASSVDFGGQPRVTDYGSWVQGVAAMNPNTVARTGAVIQARAPLGLAGAIHRLPTGLSPNIMLGAVDKYSKVQAAGGPMGPVPKTAVGTGQTAKRAGTALGYTPGGWTPPSQVIEAGMDMMPYLKESFDSPAKLSHDAPGGIPRYGVAANDGRDYLPTYKSHDWVWADRFIKMGRMPGPWQQQSFPPGYRPLQPRQQPVRYNISNTVALGRPLSRNAYFLPYQMSSSVAAQIGGGVGRPLGY